jgi:hypothetical protein
MTTNLPRRCHNDNGETEIRDKTGLNQSFNFYLLASESDPKIKSDAISKIGSTHVGGK